MGKEQEEQASLLSCLVGPDELIRIVAVMELLGAADKYVRSIALMLTGLSVKIDDEEISKDLMAARQSAEEISRWFVQHHDKLLVHIKAGQVAKPGMTIN